MNRLNKFRGIETILAVALILCNGAFAEGSLPIDCPAANTIGFEGLPYGIFKITYYKVIPPEGWTVADNSSWFEINNNKIFSLKEKKQENNKIICSYDSSFRSRDYHKDTFGSFTLVKTLANPSSI